MNPRKLDENHSFNIHIAGAVGKIEKAILLKELYGWCSMNLNRGKNIRIEIPWTYNSAKALSDKFPYMNSKSISRWLRELKSDGWISFTSKFNKNRYDRTNWYTVNFDLYDSIILGEEPETNPSKWRDSMEYTITQFEKSKERDELLMERDEEPIPSLNNYYTSKKEGEHHSSDEFQPVKEKEQAAAPHRKITNAEFVRNGQSTTLDKWVGRKQFSLLNEVAQSEKYYELLRQLHSDGKYNLFMDWLNHKQFVLKKPYKTAKGLKSLITSKFIDFTKDEVELAYEQSVTEEYAGIFPKKNIFVRSRNQEGLLPTPKCLPKPSNTPGRLSIQEEEELRRVQQMVRRAVS